MTYLKYSRIELKLKLEEEVTFSTYPTFIFHSIIGKELRRLTCLFKIDWTTDLKEGIKAFYFLYIYK